MDDKILKNLNPNYKDNKEKVESVEQVIYQINKYIRTPEDLNENFTQFIYDVITLILQHKNISGQKGDELASDLIFRTIKLFINFTEKKLGNKKNVSELLFQLIRFIFDKYYQHNFFISKDKREVANATHKELSYQDYNKFFESDFEYFEDSLKAGSFSKGDKVDVYVSRYITNSHLLKKEWIRGIISSVEKDDKQGQEVYIIKYFGETGINKIHTEKFPTNSLKIHQIGSKTKYNYNLKQDEKIDLYLERGKEKIWCLATIIEKKEDNKHDLTFINYTIEYSDNYIEIENNNNIDNPGNSFYEGNEKDDIIIPFDSFRIQSPHTFSDLQKKNLKMKKDKKYDSANNYQDLLNFMTDFLINDQRIEDFYKYESGSGEEQKINYILGKYDKNYSFYFSKLLKAMADNDHFKSVLKILKDSFTMDELKTIFCILINCVPFLHRQYYEKNYSTFKEAVIGLIKNKEEKKDWTKKDFDFFVFSLVKIKFLYKYYSDDEYYNEADFNYKYEIDELYLELGIEMIKNGLSETGKLGLELILECIEYSLDENEKIFILKKLRNTNFLNLLFNDKLIDYFKSNNNNRDFISKTEKIFGLMLKYKKYEINNEEGSKEEEDLSLTEKDLELIWNFFNKNNNDENVHLEIIIIELFEKLVKDLDTDSCGKMLNIILNNKKLIQIDELYILINKLAIKGNIENEQKKCCEYFTKKLLEEKDLNKMTKQNYILKQVIEYFPKFGKQIIEQYIEVLGENQKILFTDQINLLEDQKKKRVKENILITLVSFQKIIENQDKKYKYEELIQNKENFVSLFKDNFLLYKNIIRFELKKE